MHIAAAAPPDLISDQSNVVLGTIVSLLPTKDGCRTQALSRRWRPIWRTAPLNLDARGDGRDRLSAKTISDILSDHLGPVRRISINEADEARFKGRLSSRDVLDNIQELDLGYSYSYNDRHKLPASAFPIALPVATYARFSRPANIATDFPSLHKLSLFKIKLPQDILSGVLSGCPMLKSLLLEDIVGSHRLRSPDQLPGSQEYQLSFSSRQKTRLDHRGSRADHR